MLSRVKTIISHQLHQGTTPRALAKATAFGIVIGNFPIFGLSTGICFICGHFFRLNQPILQIVNYAMSASQLLMVPVFMYLGELLTGADHQTLVPSEVFAEFAGNKKLFFQHFGMAGVHATLAWIILAPFAGYLLYLLTHRIYVRVAVARAHQINKAE